MPSRSIWTTAPVLTANCSCTALPGEFSGSHATPSGISVITSGRVTAPRPLDTATRSPAAAPIPAAVRADSRTTAGRAVPAMQTDFARDAFDALIRVGAEAPAVVLTHLGLAGMDAFGMLRALAGHAREQGTLVIVLLEAECERAMVRARLPDEVLLLGPTDDIAELAGRLRACVEGRRNRVGTTTAILDDHH